MKAAIRRLVALSRLGIYWLQAMAIALAFRLVSLLPADAALDLVARIARKVGPLVSRHRVAEDNIALAYPDMPDTERNAIALDMWANMARLAGEYIFLDDLFDFDPDAIKPGRVEVVGEEIFRRLLDDKRPKIFFTAHLGNFEMLPIAAATFGLEVTAMFRPPSNPFVAKRILSARSTRMGHLVPSKAGAAITLARVLEAGGNVGVLVDQRFNSGLDNTFFGKPVRTNPLLGKLVRQFDCAIYPAHCIRLPGGRFRLTLEDEFPTPRDDKGRVDVPALMQAINDHVEQWVRNDPGQWMWFHKRWAEGEPRRRGGTDKAA